LPADSTANAGETAQLGACGWTVVAAETKGPISRTVVITPPETLRTRRIVGDVKVAGRVSHGMPEEPLNWALVAGPLSPLKQRSHFPPQW